MTQPKRCSWCNLNNPLYVRYHDEEWGRHCMMIKSCMSC